MYLTFLDKLYILFDSTKNKIVFNKWVVTNIDRTTSESTHINYFNSYYAPYMKFITTSTNKFVSLYISENLKLRHHPNSIYKNSSNNFYQIVKFN